MALSGEKWDSKFRAHFSAKNYLIVGLFNSSIWLYVTCHFRSIDKTHGRISGCISFISGSSLCFLSLWQRLSFFYGHVCCNPFPARRNRPCIRWCLLCQSWFLVEGNQKLRSDQLYNRSEFWPKKSRAERMPKKLSTCVANQRGSFLDLTWAYDFVLKKREESGHIFVRDQSISSTLKNFSQTIAFCSLYS